MDVLSAIAQEVVEPDELKALMDQAAKAKQDDGDAPKATATASGDGAARTSGDLRPPKAYIGFEPSGTAHVGWMVCTQMVREMVDAGFDVTILLADWHAQINDKLGGDLHAIRRCAEYMTDAFEALGLPKDSVTYRFAAEFAKDDQYWATVIQVAKHTTLARMRRAMDIMGRSEDEGDKDVSKFLYPAMQVADIFHMDIDLALGGMDQRHAHMLARDVAKKLGKKAPVAIHTPLVPNLKGGKGRMEASTPGLTEVQAKMSKSDPSSGIFIHDSAVEVAEKIQQAHCPQGEAEDNPVLDLLRLVVFPRIAGALVIARPEKFGGPLTYQSYDDLEKAYVAGDLHPADLKTGVADALNDILEPVRDYFEEHPDNLDFVQGLKTTR